MIDPLLLDLKTLEANVRALFALDDDLLSLISPPDTDPIRKYYVRAVKYIRAGDYETAQRLIYGGKVPDDFKKTIQRTVNEVYLLQRNLEWAKPGIMRTFRFWSEAEKKDYIAMASRVVGDLNKSGLNACLGFGSVLSFVRDRDLMPHDDDLDIIVAMDQSIRSFPAALDAIRGRLVDMGHEVSGDFLGHCHVVVAGDIVVDVFAGIAEDEYVTWFPGPRRAIKRSDVYAPIEARFLGVESLFPKNPYRYLELIYGHDWEKPKPLWNHIWDQEAISDLL
ncbi:hypothetical protein [Rhizobium sp. RCC_161_2]|uniref:hypothetical protein n=1 Tax=Rhizobium sp. RCC_161_2 TaxID=3239219 RepID=UPI003526AC95